MSARRTSQNTVNVTPPTSLEAHKGGKQADAVRATRPTYGTQKHRASDLADGDVTRNSYGKWDVVTKVSTNEDGRYVTVYFECGQSHQIRSVHLVDVQVVKNS